MSKPASRNDLADLHSGFAKYLQALLDRAIAGLNPAEGEADFLALGLDAATMGVIARFLKDNGTTADPADSAELDKLREQFSKAKQGVSGAAGAAVKAAMQDDDIDGLPMQ